MDIEELREPLRIEQIDFRVQSINKGGYATILAYKDARVDMNRLNAVFPLKWQRKQESINGRLFCSVGIYNDDIKEWVWVQDVGTESNAEKEKGQSSDAFKRACFNLGIGIELYDYPQISVKLRQDEWEMRKGNDGKERPSATWNLKLKEWMWYSDFEEGKISRLVAVDSTGSTRFEWGRKLPITPKVNINPKAKKEFVVQVKQCLADADVEGLNELLSEWDADEKAVLWKEFNSQQRAAIKDLTK